MSIQQGRRTPFVRALENEETTESIIGAFYAVYNALKPHLAEELYRNALIIELTRRGHTVRREVGIDVYYLGQRIGCYRVDLIVDDKVLLELKATRNCLKQTSSKRRTIFASHICEPACSYTLVRVRDSIASTPMMTRVRSSVG